MPQAQISRLRDYYELSVASFRVPLREECLAVMDLMQERPAGDGRICGARRKELSASPDHAFSVTPKSRRLRLLRVPGIWRRAAGIDFENR